MTPFQLAALFLSLVAAVGWVNARWLKLPNGVAMVLAGAAIPALSPLFDAAGLRLLDLARQVNFPETVMGSMLAFLLFAGATQVDLKEMRKRRVSVLSLASFGVLMSTALVGGGLWWIAELLHTPVPLALALAFGALISPTDPIAVLAAVKGGGLSATLKAVLQGEALFNDGVAIVVFSALLAFLGGHAPDPLQILSLVVFKAAGGLALGLGGGWLVIRLMSVIDDYAVEVTLTLALAAGAYALAEAIHLSGPIAAVAAGLLIGDTRAESVMSESTRRYVRGFWELVDEVLNALLFLLLGLQLLVVNFQVRHIGLWLGAIVLVILARLVVVLPWGTFFAVRREERGATPILVWGGLHGALSLALALSLPEGPARGVILSATYAVVVFSVVAQGLTFPRLVRWFQPPSPSPLPPSGESQADAP
jgi:CPA1 family monovalent cation:H+ antiporter